MRFALLFCVLLPAFLLPAAATAQSALSQAGPKPAAKKPQAAAALDTAKRALPDPARLNAWTVGLAAGRIEGAPLRFAAELARVLDDGDNMRVLPIVTRGIFDNVFDLLYLRGVDAAIVHGDVLEHFKKDQKISGIEGRINYLMPLFPSEVHVFVRPEITKLEELAGKVVNFNTQGTAAAYSGPIIFERLGIKVEPRFIPHPVALGEMAKNDKYAAAVFVSTKPLDPFVKRKWPEGFKFLPVPLTQTLEEYYLPAQLESADYPGLIPEGERVQTVAVPTVLAVYNWRNDRERQQRLARLVNYLFERFSKLQTEPGYHPQWSEVNLAATVPGWQRFGPMQARLNSARPKAAKNAAVGDQVPTQPGDGATPDRGATHALVRARDVQRKQ